MFISHKQRNSRSHGSYRVWIKYVISGEGCLKPEKSHICSLLHLLPASSESRLCLQFYFYKLSYFGLPLTKACLMHIKYKHIHHNNTGQQVLKYTHRNTNIANSTVSYAPMLLANAVLLSPFTLLYRRVVFHLTPEALSRWCNSRLMVSLPLACKWPCRLSA